MIVPMAYDGHSGIANGLKQTEVGFATNTLRETTFFHGTLAQGESGQGPVLFREAWPPCTRSW